MVRDTALWRPCPWPLPFPLPSLSCLPPKPEELGCNDAREGVNMADQLAQQGCQDGNGGCPPRMLPHCMLPHALPRPALNPLSSAHPHRGQTTPSCKAGRVIGLLGAGPARCIAVRLRWPPWALGRGAACAPPPPPRSTLLAGAPMVPSRLPSLQGKLHSPVHHGHIHSGLHNQVRDLHQLLRQRKRGHAVQPRSALPAPQGMVKGHPAALPR